MRAWQIRHHTPSAQSDLDRVIALVTAIGARDDRVFAQSVLGLFDDQPGITQCVVFACAPGKRARTLSVADYRGGSYLRTVADAYAQRFHALDGIQSILVERAAAQPVLHQQSHAEIGHEAYRQMCYLQPSVSERLALLAPQPCNVWLSINFYRSHQGGGGFRPGEIERVEAAAPLVVHAAKRHYALCSQRMVDEMPMAERLTRLCPELSSRERDVLCGILGSRTTPEIAAQLGVQISSVTSYQKRAYRRLGISGQRQLFALLQMP
jgi:DNA-binding CsgD family transcriptional regulator